MGCLSAVRWEREVNCNQVVQTEEEGGSAIGKGTLLPRSDFGVSGAHGLDDGC
jgi:hypothetical protein